MKFVKTAAKKASPSGFSLIEMLTVIAVIAILASMIFPINKAMVRTRVRSRIKAELTQVETAINLYHDKRGHYPPDNNIPNDRRGPYASYANQLYYELAGTTNWGPGSDISYRTLDGGSQVDANTVKAALAYPTPTGFVNTTAATSADEGSTAVNCMKGAFRPDQIGQTPAGFRLLVGSIPLPANLKPGPGQTPPYPGSFQLANNPNAWYCAWRYNSSNPTNNPSAYDLWIDVIIDGQTNRFSNWTRDAVIVNSP